MIIQIIIWGALVPSLLVGVPLAVAWWAPKADPRPASPSDWPWVAGAAIGLGYAIAQWVMPGASGPTSMDVGGRLVYLGAAGALLGLWETHPAAAGWARWVIRFIAAVGASLLMVGPRAEAAAWSMGTHLAMVAVLSSATLWVWTLLELQARQERGPQLALCLLGLMGASSLALVLSGTATTAQLAGLLAAGLGATFLLVWRFPKLGRLRSAAPPVALITVAQWGIGLHYASMPPATFALLAIAPAALLVARLPRWKKTPRTIGLALRLATLAVPLGLAVGAAAATYLAEPAPEATATSDDEADYGY